MPITLIGTPQTGVANNGGNVTLTWSTTPSQNDYTVVVVTAPATSVVDVSMSTAGYTRLAYHTGTGNTQAAIGIFYKKQGASPDSTAVCIGGNGVATDTTAIGYVLRGVDLTNPSDQTPPTKAGPTASTNPDPPQIVTQTNGAWVLVAACSIQTIDTAVTVPTGYSNGFNVGGADTTDNTTAAATKAVATAGTENPASWTDWTTGTWTALTVAFRPIAIVQTTMTAQVTNYAVTEQNVTTSVKRNYKLSAQVTNYAVTGQNVNLLKALKLSAQVTNYVITGQDATTKVAKNYKLTTEITSFAVTGQDVTTTIIHKFTLTAQVTAYTITGQTVTTTYAEPVTFISGIKSLKYSFDGSPWARLATKAGLGVNTLQYSLDGSPWWGVEPSALTWTAYLLKYYTGGTWTTKPLKWHNGSIWVEKDLKKL